MSASFPYEATNKPEQRIQSAQGSNRGNLLSAVYEIICGGSVDWFPAERNQMIYRVTRRSIADVSSVLSLSAMAAMLFLSACSSTVPSAETAETAASSTGEESSETAAPSGSEDSVRSVVNFDHELDSYVPRRNHYNFYFTYKTVHPWWDAVALGMEEAQRQYLERGVTVTYEYMAPEAASAEDQTQRLLAAEQENYDVIGVDVADEKIISPLLDQMIEDGQNVMTFSSSDAAPGCRRIAYVGNTHNYQDGVDLTKALCEKLGYRGKIAILVGSVGAPCHEDRARGAMDAIAKYDEMEIVAKEYDMDSVDLAYDLTKRILEDCPDLDGIVCCNMSNPVGAARAVTETGSSAVIVGMDHDEEALHYLDEGVIYCLGVQDCYSIGFDTIQTAVKIADGNAAGDLFPEKTDEITTVIYQKDAAQMLELLYGDIS